MWRGAREKIVLGPEPTSSSQVAVPSPQIAAKISDDSGTRFGLGIIAVIVGGLVGGVALLRSEARRMLRRREHAAF